MARIRTVKPELFKHEDLYDLEKKTGLPIRLAFIGMFACSDREGRFKWRPRALKLDIVPYDDIDFELVLEKMAEAGFVEKYEHEGECYGWIPTFLKHQAINQREAQSSLPDPNGPHVKKPTLHVHAHADDVSAYEYRGVNVAPALRETIFARDGRKCVRCGAQEDLTVDHIFPQSIGGTHAPANLRTLCRSCNSARPVAGQPLLDDLAKDGYTLDDMQRTCMHVQTRGEGKGREGKGTGKEEEGNNPLVVLTPDAPKKGEVVTEIFAYWQKQMQSPNSKLDDKRKALIEKALKNFTPRQVCEAILGCSRTPHNMGKNEAGTKYNGLNVILRDADQIERFMRAAHVTPKAPKSAETIEETNARVLAELGMGATVPDDGMTIDMEEVEDESR